MEKLLLGVLPAWYGLKRFPGGHTLGLGLPERCFVSLQKTCNCDPEARRLQTDQFESGTGVPTVSHARNFAQRSYFDRRRPNAQPRKACNFDTC